MAISDSPESPASGPQQGRTALSFHPDHLVGPMSLSASDYVLTHDASIRIDAPASYLALRRGEFMIDALSSVEDSKGAGGERGELTLTNLRVMWVSHRTSRLSMSIGWDTLLPGRGLAVRSASSKTRGNLQALYIAATFQGAKFEFIFTSLVKASPRLFSTALAVLKSYESSRVFREVKLRSALFRPEDKTLVMLPRERVFSKVECMNLAKESGALGQATVTSQRFTWRATFAENFNVSIPYLMIVRLDSTARAQARGILPPNPLPPPPPSLSLLRRSRSKLKSTAVSAPRS